MSRFFLPFSCAKQRSLYFVMIEDKIWINLNLLSLIKTSKIIYANDRQENWDHGDLPTGWRTNQKWQGYSLKFLWLSREVTALFQKCEFSSRNKFVSHPPWGLPEFFRLKWKSCIRAFGGWCRKLICERDRGEKNRYIRANCFAKRQEQLNYKIVLLYLDSFVSREHLWKQLRS